MTAARYLPAARREFLQARDHYEIEEESPHAAQAFVAEVARALDQIVAYPDSGTPHLSGTRRLPLKRFPFGIIYEIDGDTAVIIAVAHDRRRPNYWVNRL